MEDVNNRKPDLPATGERFIPGSYENQQMAIEHFVRYFNAAHYCAGKIVLDIASGEGYGSSILANVAKEVIGVDVALNAVEHASKKYQGKNNLRYVTGSVTRIPLKSHTVDVVVSFETIEHVDAESQSCMLTEIKRVLKPDGFLLISSPNKKVYTCNRRERNHFHVHELYRGEFIDLVKKYFQNIKVGEQTFLQGSLLMWDQAPVESAYYPNREFISGLQDALYMLIIASDENLPAPISTIYQATDFVNIEAVLHKTQELLMRTQHALEDTQVALKEKVAELDLNKRVAARLQQVHEESARIIEDKERALAASQDKCKQTECILCETQGSLMRTQHALEDTQVALKENMAELDSVRDAFYTSDNALQDLRIACQQRNIQDVESSPFRERVLGYLWRHEKTRFLVELYCGMDWRTAELTTLEIPPLPNIESLVQPPVKDSPAPQAQIAYDSWYESDVDYSDYKADVKPIAFYLPQFHTFKENDEWWGQGFTEWTNTRKTKPRFPSHYQPREPHPDIGHYDLSDWHVIAKQAELARRHGIYGFCFYNYWFSGKRLMETPVDLLLSHPEIDIHFCLCWANENWTRRWDGKDAEILIEQGYENDSVQYIVDLKKYIDDPRYIRVKGKPVVMIYRPSLLPDASKTFACWRKWARENDIGEILIWIQRGCAKVGESAMIEGADAEVEFPPNGTAEFDLYKPESVGMPPEKGALLGFRRLVDNVIAGRASVDKFTHDIYRGVMLGWDNASRRDIGFCSWWGFSMCDYYRWLRFVVADTKRRHSEDDAFFFINAWNEWAEGTYLEPDKRFGYTSLNVTSRAVLGLPLNPKRISDVTSKKNPLEEFAAVNLYQRGIPSFPFGLYWMYHDIEPHYPCIAWYYWNELEDPIHELAELADRYHQDEERVYRRLRIHQLGMDRLVPARNILPCRIGIHLHLFYPDMIEWVCEYLKNIPLPFDLLISVPEGVRVLAEEIASIQASIPQLQHIVYRRTPNRGRDVAPFICTFGNLLKDYDYIAHFHTKKSLHTESHHVWAEFIFQHLLGSKVQVRNIISLLQNGFGVVAPPDFMAMPEDPSGWGEGNMKLAQLVLDKTNLKINLKKEFPVIEFPQGSMFWASSSYLQRCLTLPLNYDDFPGEPIGTDGTLAHALERLFYIWGCDQGKMIAQVFMLGEENYPTRRRSLNR